MANAGAMRAMDMCFEDGKIRNPLKGLFPADLPLPSLATALYEIGHQYPNLNPSNGQMVKMARQHAKSCDRSAMQGLTDDEIISIILYTMEDTPRENSLYFALNAALRSMDRGGVKMWRDYIWLLLHALRKLPPPPERMVYRGLKFEPTSPFPKPNITNGHSATWSAFSSTASKAEVMSTFLGTDGERIMYNIELTEPIARDVRAFSLFPSENELLLPPNFSFEIVSTFPAGVGLTIVQCKQTETLDTIVPDQ